MQRSFSSRCLLARKDIAFLTEKQQKQESTERPSSSRFWQQHVRQCLTRQGKKPFAFLLLHPRINVSNVARLRLTLAVKIKHDLMRPIWFTHRSAPDPFRVVLRLMEWFFAHTLVYYRDSLDRRGWVGKTFSSLIISLGLGAADPT